MEAQITIGVMAHYSRAKDAQWLQNQVAADVVSVDHGNLGEWNNGARLWQTLSTSKTDWCIVLQDDAIPVDSFRGHAIDALTYAPLTGVSFYTGTSRPRNAETAYALEQAQAGGESWLMASEMLWGVGIAMPTDQIKPMLEWAGRSTDPYDRRIGQWFAHLGKAIWYTNPSLVDHRDGPSIVYAQEGRKAPPERRARNFGVPKRGWATGAVRIPEPGTLRS